MANGTTYDYDFLGPKKVFIGTNEIPAEFVADEVGTITITEATTEIATQAGTTNIPNGTYEELSATLNIIIPEMRFFKLLFPDLYTDAKFNSPDGDPTGQVTFAAGACRSTTSVPVVIQRQCEDGSSQNITIPRALFTNGGEFTISNDPFSVELNIAILPGAGGGVIFGEGSLEHPTKWDAATGAYVPLS